MSKVKITIEHEDTTVSYEKDAVLFIAFSEEDEMLECNSGLIGTTSKAVLADAVAHALMEHDKKLEFPLAKKVATIIALERLTEALDRGDE